MIEATRRPARLDMPASGVDSHDSIEPLAIPHALPDVDWQFITEWIHQLVNDGPGRSDTGSSSR